MLVHDVGIFVMLAMGMSTLSVITTIFVLYVHHKNWTRPMPSWIQRIAFHVLARVMCMTPSVGDDHQRSNNIADRCDLKVYLYILLVRFVIIVVIRYYAKTCNKTR